MGTVTYRKQPGIHATRGAVPLAGTAHTYTVSDVLWPEEVEEYLQGRLVYPTLHVCCGKSRIGDVLLDLYELADVQADAARLPFPERSFGTVLIDPPYNGKFQWNHDMLNELIRVADRRIIFQHWFMPINKYGRLKKAHAFELKDVVLVPSLSGHESELVTALYDPETGKYYIAQEEPDGPEFALNYTAVWQPRAYFGRTQIIQVYDRYD